MQQTSKLGVTYFQIPIATSNFGGYLFPKPNAKKRSWLPIFQNVASFDLTYIISGPPNYVFIKLYYTKLAIFGSVYSHNST